MGMNDCSCLKLSHSYPCLALENLNLATTPQHTHTPEFRHVLMIMELLTRDININRTIVGV